MMDRPKLPDGPMFCKGPFGILEGTAWIVGFDAWGETCHVADIRGWGYLTGHGRGLGLSGNEARAAQQRAMQFIVDAMNEKLARDAAAEAPDVAAMIRDAEIELLRQIEMEWRVHPSMDCPRRNLQSRITTLEAIRAEAAALRGEKEPK